jgi:hypothetical protein
LQLGGASLLGLGLPTLLASRSSASGVIHRPQGRAKNCIVLFMLGGPSQFETWDPKPEAPVEIRGPFQPIRTKTPDLLVSELMPRTATLTDKIAVLRSVSTGDNAHSTGGYTMITGVPHQPIGVEFAPPGAPNDWPCMGAVVKQLLPSNGMPNAFTLPEVAANVGNKTWPGQDGGWLGRAADPWLLTCDPSAKDFRVPSLPLPDGVGIERLSHRRSLLETLDRQLEAAERVGDLRGHSTWQKQAFEMIRSPAAREAFSLDQESEATRDRYGRNRFGQSVLLARRLVEAGVTLVQVNWVRIDGADNNGTWDTHTTNAETMRDHLMPRMDQSYSALLEDLSERGLLDETLVVWMGEMGRTPKINARGGRDHWGNVFPAAFAGGGVQGGIVHGASDRQGALPLAGRVSPADITATIFESLGIPPDTAIVDRRGRPHPVSRGRVIREIL